MSFSTDMAKLVADQLSRFVTLNPHQLAGHVANLDFWIAQVQHALDVLDGYGVRYVRLHDFQQHFVAQHHVVNTHGMGLPVLPSRIPDRELRAARRALTDAAYRFLSRCRQEDLLPEEQFAVVCESIGMSVNGKPLNE